MIRPQTSEGRGLECLRAGVVMLVWPISSIVALSIVAGVWLVVIGTTEIVWTVNVRSTAKKVERGIEPLTRGAVA